MAESDTQPILVESGMSVHTCRSGDGAELTISVDGRFDFTVHEDFRLASENAATPAARYVVDLSHAEYVDSSALGMLLLLREHAGRTTRRVSIRNARPHVERVLTVANFHKLFVMA